MKKIMFIALALLAAACEKPVLDEDAVSTKEANVILRFKQYDQAPFSVGSGSPAVTRTATDEVNRNRLPEPLRTSRRCARG